MTAAIRLALSMWIAAAASAAPVDHAGLIYIGSKAGDGAVHSAPGGPVVAHAPRGIRVVYRKTIAGESGQPAWYFIEPPGATSGWIAASETAEVRPEPPPAVKPVTTGGVKVGAKTATVMTAAARGLDSRASSATKQDDEKSLQQFAAFEKHVNVHFDDPEDAKGVYPTTTTGRRRPMAAQFREGGK